MGGDGSKVAKRGEIKIPLDEARRMGQRLQERINHAKMSQRELAARLGCAPEMVNKMVNKGGGSLAGWRQACKILGASMDYVVMLEYEKADPEFQHFLKANQEMGRQLEAMSRKLEQLTKERDQLSEQIGKLQGKRT